MTHIEALKLAKAALEEQHRVGLEYHFDSYDQSSIQGMTVEALQAIDTALKSGEQPSAEMVERVALALFREESGDKATWDEQAEWAKDLYREHAKTAIAAIMGDASNYSANNQIAGVKVLEATSPTSEPVGVDEQSAKGDFMLTDEQIKHMRDRFLGWKLPKDFRPDNGISYTPTQFSAATGEMPYGTNVFDAQQAEQMIRFMLEGLPQATPNQVKVSVEENSRLSEQTEKIAAWVASEEGQKALKETSAEVRDMLERMAKERVLDHEILRKPMTI